MFMPKDRLIEKNLSKRIPTYSESLAILSPLARPIDNHDEVVARLTAKTKCGGKR